MADLGSVGLDAEITITAVKLLDIGAAPSLTKTVSGVIYDDANAVTARTVRATAREPARVAARSSENRRGPSSRAIITTPNVQLNAARSSASRTIGVSDVGRIRGPTSRVPRPGPKLDPID